MSKHYVVLLSALLLACGSHGSTNHHDGSVTFHDGGTSGTDGSLGGCGGGLVHCSSGCTDPLTDPRNCGACDNPCPTGQACASGQCTSGGTCPTGTRDCGSGCVDITSDPSNCGGCNIACDSTTQTCSGGKCICTGGLKLCGGACIDTTGDPSNCGTCGHVCPSGTCNNSVCGTSTGGMTGCNGFLMCLNNCAAGNTTCEQTCSTNATTQGKQLYLAIYCCVVGDPAGQTNCSSFGGTPACPQSTGGICDSSSASYNQTNCDNCLNAAQMAGGACYSTLQACLNNKP